MAIAGNSEQVDYLFVIHSFIHSTMPTLQERMEAYREKLEAIRGNDEGKQALKRVPRCERCHFHKSPIEDDQRHRITYVCELGDDCQLCLSLENCGWERGTPIHPPSHSTGTHRCSIGHEEEATLLKMEKLQKKIDAQEKKKAAVELNKTNRFTMNGVFSGMR